MKTYDEVTACVLEGARLRRQKNRQIRYTASVSAVCAVCILGLTVYMNLEKPEVLPLEQETHTATVQSDSAYYTDASANPSGTMTYSLEQPGAESGPPGSDASGNAFPTDLTEPPASAPGADAKPEETDPDENHAETSDDAAGESPFPANTDEENSLDPVNPNEPDTDDTPSDDGNTDDPVGDYPNDDGDSIGNGHPDGDIMDSTIPSEETTVFITETTTTTTVETIPVHPLPSSFVPETTPAEGEQTTSCVMQSVQSDIDP